MKEQRGGRKPSGKTAFCYDQESPTKEHRKKLNFAVIFMKEGLFLKKPPFTQ